MLSLYQVLYRLLAIVKAFFDWFYALLFFGVPYKYLLNAMGPYF